MKNLTNTTPLYARFDIDLDYCTAEAAKKNLARYDYADLTVPNGIVWLAEDEDNGLKVVSVYEADVEFEVSSY